ncbi:MAG: efflux RND transporter periplasmic adaptor subunit [Acidobacteriota bacterium]
MSNDQQEGERALSRGSIWTHPVWIAPLAVIAGLALLAAIGRESRAQDEEPSRRLRVATQVVERVPTYEVARSFVGRIEAARSSDLGFELAGLVDRVWVEEGDVVEAGQRLASLDRQRLRSRRNELEASLEQARAGSELAQATYDRVAEAAELDAVADQEYDEARLSLRTREATVRQLEAQIESVDVELEKSILQAPYAAVVAARWVDEGEVLPAGQAVLRLLEANRLEARIGVTPEQAAKLSPGDPATLTVRDRQLTARVKAVLPEREVRTRTVSVLLTLEDDAESSSANLTGSGPARSGDLAELVLSQPVAEAGFWLPSSALSEGVRGLWSCYVVELDEADGGFRVARRDVEVLHTETDRVFVRGTLQAGDQLVTAGVHRLVPGQRVEVESAS